MKINVKAPLRIAFNALELGQVFRYDSQYYMRIETVSLPETCNAVRLADGIQTLFSFSTEVDLVKAELIVG